MTLRERKQTNKRKREEALVLRTIGFTYEGIGSALGITTELSRRWVMDERRWRRIRGLNA